MNPTWLTIVVAVIGVLGTLSAGWLTGRRADRATNADRAARQLEEERSLKRATYADVLRTARTLDRRVAASRSATELDDVLEQLLSAASHVELLSPELASGLLSTVIDLAERLVDLAKRRPATNEVIDETRADYTSALDDLTHRLHTEISRPSPH
ncbi:hypothetical protein [Kribbella solani]|uniref:Uncharacterized protein Yka (UPF0111/DUF47 family) n=1 Tax=Kribbella solani TaxID=236067 RepID=A0A841DLI7_9ACTN|nr:hypothetical protein [Kribbella solani]MBB5977297.1 uncharacterized protein Yka (UPF0111/DUF47 family) [Kribbella solani]